MFMVIFLSFCDHEISVKLNLPKFVALVPEGGGGVT